VGRDVEGKGRRVLVGTIARHIRIIRVCADGRVPPERIVVNSARKNQLPGRGSDKVDLLVLESGRNIKTRGRGR